MVQSHFSSSPSRAGVEGCPETSTPSGRFRIETPPVSWLGSGPLLRPQRGLPNSPPNRAIRRLISGSRRKNPALQSRGGDGFSPSSRYAESPVLSTVRHRLNISTGATPLAKANHLPRCLQKKSLRHPNAKKRKTRPPWPFTAHLKKRHCLIAV
jgi:hypothetical protein